MFLKTFFKSTHGFFGKSWLIGKKQQLRNANQCLCSDLHCAIKDCTVVLRL